MQNKNCKPLSAASEGSELAPCVWATARVANLAWSHCTHPTTVDTIVSGDIQTSGCFECESVAAILATMRQQRPSLLVDVGGNIGMYTAAAATQGHRVHTYEPVPTNAARIRETLRRNRLEQRVTLYEACLGPAPGWAALGQNTTNQGGIRHELVASGADPGADRHLVPVVSLDTQPPPPADLNVFIKMDIEGSECGALGGAWRFLNATRVIGVLMEWKFVRRDRRCCATLQRMHTLLHERHRLLPYAWKRGVLAQNPLRRPEQMCRPRGSKVWADDLLWKKVV